MRRLQSKIIERPIAASMFFLGICLLGVLSLSRLELSLMPSLEYPRLTIITLFPNASPREVENLITKPVAEAAGRVAGVKKISSESIEGISFVRLQFDWSVNTNYAAMEVREKTDLIRGILPEDAARPIVARFDPSQEPLMEIVFFAKKLNRPRDLRSFVRDEAKPFLDRVDGAAMVRLSGGYKREIRIDVDRYKLYARSLNLESISNTIAAANINFPAGRISSGSRDILIRAIGEYASISDIGKTIVSASESGAPVRLDDIAQIRDDYRDRTGLSRYNSKECVLVSVYREPGKNSVETARRLHAAVVDLQNKFNRELDVRVVYDESRFVMRSVQNITRSLIIGAILAFAVLVLILRNLKSPIILLTSLPVSLLSCFVLMHFRGISLNMMSLGGLAVGTGMLFDAGNVVLAAIERHRRLGLNAREAAIAGVGEVSGSVTAAVLTTVIVFLPIIFLRGVVGAVFAEMAMTITFALLASLVVSLALIPMLSSLGNSVPKFDLEERSALLRKAARIESRIDALYVRALSHFLNRPGHLFLIVAFLFLLALTSVPFTEREFIPHADTGEFRVELSLPRTSSLSSTESATIAVEKAVSQSGKTKHMISSIGYDEESLLSRKDGDVGMHRASIRVILPDDRATSTKSFIKILRHRIRLRKDISVRIVESGDRLSGIIGGQSQSVALSLSGTDLITLSDLGQNIRENLANTPGIFDVKTSMQEKARELHIELDDLRLANFGLSRDYVARYLRTAIAGSTVTRLRLGDREIDLRLRFRKEDRNSSQQIRFLPLKTSEGNNVNLSQIGKTLERPGYSSILRSGQERINRITASIEGISMNDAVANIEDLIIETKLPPGYRLRLAGDRDEMRTSFRELGLAFVLAAVLIYMLLAAQFESLVYPAVMMAAVPLIMAGVFPALLLSGRSLNVNSFVGIILLTGIVVDGAVLFFEYLNLSRKDGKSIRDAVISGGRIVLRPALMNNSTTALALLPVALELGDGSEFQSPLATAVISGIVIALFLNLFLLPVVFHILLRRKKDLPASLAATLDNTTQKKESAA